MGALETIHTVHCLRVPRKPFVSSTQDTDRTVNHGFLKWASVKNREIGVLRVSKRILDTLSEIGFLDYNPQLGL